MAVSLLWHHYCAFQIVVNTVPEKTVGELCVMSQKNIFFVYEKEECNEVCGIALQSIISLFD